MKEAFLDRAESMHERLGTAGFVLAVIALIVALSGGAYAASGGLTGKQKKQVTKIAKKFAGKQGPQGPQGLPGAPGTNGTNGKDGVNGTNGAPGAPGKSVVVANEEPGSCANEEGVAYEVEGSGQLNEVCRGPEGSPWTAGGTLPEEATETGAWVISTDSSGGPALAGLSFAIPLASSLDAEHVHFIDASGNEVHGPNAGNPQAACSGDAESPTAASGNLCVYEGFAFGASYTGIDQANNGSGTPGADTAGAILSFGFASGLALANGTYAVTG